MLKIEIEIIDITNQKEDNQIEINKQKYAKKHSIIPTYSATTNIEVIDAIGIHAQN
jgi:hypothetical protein